MIHQSITIQKDLILIDSLGQGHSILARADASMLRTLPIAITLLLVLAAGFVLVTIWVRTLFSCLPLGFSGGLIYRRQLTSQRAKGQATICGITLPNDCSAPIHFRWILGSEVLLKSALFEKGLEIILLGTLVWKISAGQWVAERLD